MDTGGPQYDVHPSDCAQFTGKSLSLVSDLKHSFFLLFLFFVYTISKLWGVSVREACVITSQTSIFLVDSLSTLSTSRLLNNLPHTP